MNEHYLSTCSVPPTETPVDVGRRGPFPPFPTELALLRLCANSLPSCVPSTAIVRVHFRALPMVLSEQVL